MRPEPPDFSVLSDAECERVVRFMLDVLADVGMRVENEKMCAHLAEHGIEWDGKFRVRFPRRVMEAYIERERTARAEAVGETPSVTPPRETDISGTVGGYPLRWVDPADSAIKTQTLSSMADLMRLSDWIPSISAIGTVGVPSDVPPPLQPFFMRFANWRYTTKLSNTYVIWDPALCPYIVELCETISSMESEHGGMERWFRANNYLVSPLRYPQREAEEFMWFYERGYRCTFGQLSSIGGTTPVTLAGSVGLSLAETLAISFIMNAFYGDRGLHIGTVIAPLDMRTGFMPYGRPEQMLAYLAQRDVCAHLGTQDEFAFGTPCGAKGTDFEAGMAKGLQAGLQLALFGKVRWSFGKFSTDEVIDPRMMLIEHDAIGGLRRFAEGIRVDDDTLPLEVVKEVGPGGVFLTHPHTLEHYKEELWTPKLMSGENLEAWKAAGSVDILEKARRRAVEILAEHHPRGIKRETEEALLALIDRFAVDIGVTEYKRPRIPQ